MSKNMTRRNHHVASFDWLHYRQSVEQSCKRHRVKEVVKARDENSPPLRRWLLTEPSSFYPLSPSTHDTLAQTSELKVYFPKLFKMADRLTPLQDCLDQFLVQMFATVRYIDTHHSYEHIDGQTDQFTPVTDSMLSQSDTAAHTTSQQSQPSHNAEPASSSNPHPDPPSLFTQRLSELAQDLVLKEQQIEALVAALPGMGSSQEAQEAR